ncbi:ABC transporter ATP-binding protein [Scytonema hofmannii PCC 7110]|uniref:ABC transporter ATP-binding protein n=1 Tax=Scytonema hofmannii PCC 7110 TaxID=128403 RepID=A0A139X979_9CYAN|nr:ABC transporter ATP-binding protein [Scytonema hofmannii]KYC41192.1 ABC transporter ATP-binding protein [Scytonema hofmannii PCC 7110]
MTKLKSNFLVLEKVSKSFDGLKVLNEISCSIRAGEIVGLLGLNGSGKTTLFNVMTNLLRADSGKVIFRERNLHQFSPHEIAKIGITRTFQDLRLIRRLTVLENVLLSFKHQPGEKLTNLFLNWKKSENREIKHSQISQKILNNVGLADKSNTLAEDLSYGQQKLLSIVCCLATGADLLLLDEPIAGVSPAAIEQIIPLIKDLPRQNKSAVLIEHNPDVVKEICDRVFFLDAGSLIIQGTPEQVYNNSKVIEAYLR